MAYGHRNISDRISSQVIFGLILELQKTPPFKVDWSANPAIK